MPLKMIVDTLDDVPEVLRDQYAKADDGKFKLAIDGIEDTGALKKALKAERDARADFEKKLKAFDGLDPVEAREILTRFENDEELQLIKKGDTAKLRDRWTEKMRKDHDVKVKALEDAVTSAKNTGSKWQSRVLDNAVREAAAKVGLHSHAVEDALFRARSMFVLDDEGNAVQIRDGHPVLGKDGNTPYSPAEWLESMREVAPHWFPAMAGGSGSRQSSSGAGNGQTRTIKRSAFNALDPKARAAHFKEGGTVIDDPR
jgi:hypothetical protein